MRALPFLALLLCAGPAVAAPQFATIYAFLDGKDGSVPEAVTAGPDGALYGTTSSGGKQDHGTVFKLSPPAVPGAAWMKETLHTFTPDQSGRPFSRVIFDQDTGALLGTASGQEGGQHNGAVFRLAPPAQAGGNWTYTIIHDFTGGDDGEGPFAELTQDPATGTIYGTSEGDPFDHTGLGTVFAFTPNASHTTWTRTLNHVFTGADGADPVSGVALGADGLLYGSTVQGGAGFGTIFSLDPATDALTTLFEPQSASERYVFLGGGAPALSDDGATMYGTSSSGDQTHCKTDRLFACGAVISMPVDGGAPPAVLQKFAGKKTAAPIDGLVWNKTHRVLYGSAYLGLPNICKYQGRQFGCGIVFKLIRKNGQWKYRLIHAFDGTDGQNPGQLTVGSDGTLYGTTFGGGASKAGTVFRIENP